MDFLRVLHAANNLLASHGGSIQFMILGNELRMHAIINGNGFEVMEKKRAVPMVTIKQMEQSLVDGFLWAEIQGLADSLLAYKENQKVLSNQPV